MTEVVNFVLGVDQFGRQGDVGVMPVSISFDGPDAREHNMVVLAHGEVTGHAHVIDHPRAKFTNDAAVVEALRKELVSKGILTEEDSEGVVIGGITIEGNEPVALRHGDLHTGAHPDHTTHLYPPGNYAAFRKREYQPGPLRSRMVAD